MKLLYVTVEETEAGLQKGKVYLRLYTWIFVGLSSFLRLGSSEADLEIRILLQVIYSRALRRNWKEVRQAGQGRQKSQKVCNFRQSPKWWLPSSPIGNLWGVNNASKFIRTGEKRPEYRLTSRWLRVRMGIDSLWGVVGGQTCQAFSSICTFGHTATRQASRESQGWQP